MPKGQPLLPRKAKNENWRTPGWIYDPLDGEFHFTIDVAANADNSKCERYYDKEADGTAQSWVGEVPWDNPPYNVEDLSNFIFKAMSEARAHQVTSVHLVPAKTDQEWWHWLWAARTSGDLDIELRWISGRVKHIGADNQAGFAQVIVIIHGHPRPMAERVDRPAPERPNRRNRSAGRNS